MQALIALLLTILFAQAVPAHEITLDRTRGSVFSAATVEVPLPPEVRERLETARLESSGRSTLRIRAEQ